MPPKIRVGIPSFVDDALLERFPPEAEIVKIDPQSKGELDVEFLLAPWSQGQVDLVLPRLRGTRIVQSFGAGIEGLLPLIPEGAVLCNARNLHNVPTAEWALTAILASLKFLPMYAKLQSEARWVRRADADSNYQAIYGTPGTSILPVLCEELAGKTVLIVGYGAIGKAIEERLAAFEPTILRVARSPREGVSPVSELPSLLPQADVVVLITPLTPETHHLIDAAAIALMKQGALLVNAARGAVVDTDALVAALEQRRIRAALDVTDPEPLPETHPLWRAPGLLLTPHVAGSSPVYLKRVIDFAQAQLVRYMRGEPLHNVIESSY
jgi:phosphoglycerate dehydrogenase-like enzyme